MTTGQRLKYTCSIRTHHTRWGPIQHLVVKRRDGKAGISWDHLQELKDEFLGTDTHAVEFYPSADQVVNEINARHLWEVPTEHLPPYGFFRL